MIVTAAEYYHELNIWMDALTIFRKTKVSLLKECILEKFYRIIYTNSVIKRNIFVDGIPNRKSVVQNIIIRKIRTKLHTRITTFIKANLSKLNGKNKHSQTLFQKL